MGTLLPQTPSTGLASPSSSSSPNSNPIFPVSASCSPPLRSLPSVSCRTCQEPVNGGGRAGAVESSGSSVFGPVPSLGEIGRAISALQCFLQRVSSSASDGNWVQLLGCDSRLLISAGLGRVNYAFHLLQTEPSIKRLVISLACDRAIWEAILNNESVRKFLESLSSENAMPRIISEEAGVESNSDSDILWWFLDIMKVKEKISELIEKFKSLMNEIFQQRSDGMKQARAETTAQLEEQVQSSLLLSVLILLIVVLARVYGAQYSSLTNWNVAIYYKCKDVYGYIYIYCLCVEVVSCE